MDDESRVDEKLRETRARRSVRVETEALIAAVLAALVGLGIGLLIFRGRYSPIWQDFGSGWSVGLDASVTVGVVGLLVSGVSYWRSMRLPPQAWRRRLPWWKQLIDGAAVATVHAALATLVTGTVFFVLQHAFRRLSIGTYVATFAVAVSAGLAAYLLYLSVTRLTSVTLWERLIAFQIGGVLLAMATSSDPIWWRYHFSHLGAVGGWPSLIFNATMVITGVLVVTFALYIDRDVRVLRRRVGIGFRWSGPAISALVVALGMSLAGIGLVQVNVSLVLHNFVAGSTALIFAVLLIVSSAALWGMPWSFHITTFVILAVLAADVWLRFQVNYFNLTSFELVAFVILFGWIAILVRFIAALLGSGPSAGTESPPTEV